MPGFLELPLEVRQMIHHEIYDGVSYSGFTFNIGCKLYMANPLDAQRALPVLYANTCYIDVTHANQRRRWGKTGQEHRGLLRNLTLVNEHTSIST